MLNGMLVVTLKASKITKALRSQKTTDPSVRQSTPQVLYLQSLNLCGHGSQILSTFISDLWNVLANT